MLVRVELFSGPKIFENISYWIFPSLTPGTTYPQTRFADTRPGYPARLALDFPDRNTMLPGCSRALSGS
jgi:hypothetical protein